MKEDPLADPHQANRTFWDASTDWWKEREDQRGLWMRAPQEPRLVLSEAEMRYVADIQGVEVCGLGSGDNEVAFALAGLGGCVTSVDISARRLAVAADRARTLNFSVRFVQADVTDLSVLADDSFGLVYTGGHVSVWVADLQQCGSRAHPRTGRPLHRARVPPHAADVGRCRQLRTPLSLSRSRSPSQLVGKATDV